MKSFDRANRGNLPLSVRTVTSYEVAKVIGVAPRTVCKWFDRGLLPGFKLPGSLDRRIYVRDLIQFLKDREMRVPPELVTGSVVLVYGVSGVAPTESCRFAPDAAVAGYVVASEQLSGAVIGDDEGLGTAVQVAALVRRHHPAAAILFVLSEDVPAGALIGAGFADCARLPRSEAAARLPGLLAG